MKKKNAISFGLVGIITLAAVIGFSMTACGGGGGGGGGDPALTGTVSISGTAEAGQTLTAVTTALEGTGTITYQWKRGSAVVGTNSGTYQVQAADVGSTITVTVTRAGYTGSVTSEPTNVVTDPSLPALTGTVSISGTAAVGQTLTADTSALGGTGTITYQWKRGSAVIGTSGTYAVAAADIGSTITVTVTRSGNSGHVTSDPTDVIIDPSLPALTGTVSISGTAAVGQTLTADTSALGGTGTITYQWKRGSAVIGTSGTYAVAAADIGSTITVTVTRSGNSGHVISNPTDVIIDPSLPALTGTVTISGTAEVGQTLTAVTTALEGTGTITYQWKRGTTDIGTSSTYAVAAADVGSTITVTVTRAGYNGSVTSAPTATVLATPGNVTVTVTIGTDAAISNPSIVGGVLTLNRSATATLTLANSAQYDADSIRWKVQNTAITGSGATFTLNAANLVYQTGKLYFVTVEAERNGIPYDQTITFKVTE